MESPGTPESARAPVISDSNWSIAAATVSAVAAEGPATGVAWARGESACRASTPAAATPPIPFVNVRRDMCIFLPVDSIALPLRAKRQIPGAPIATGSHTLCDYVSLYRYGQAA